MTKDEYVKQLVAGGGYTSQQIYDMGNSFEGDEPAEEVKTNDPAVNAEASAGSENNTASESEDGSSESPAIMPDQVITKGGYQHKYLIDPETKQGVYYRRPANAADDVGWTNLNKNDSESGMLDKASTAYHFGHSDMSASKRKKYEDQIKAKKKYLRDKAEAMKQYARDDEKGILGILAGDDNKFFGNFGFGEGKEFTWDAFTEDISDMKFGESIARAGGETVELIIDETSLMLDTVLEPIAGALNATGILDLSDYEDDSWDGISFNNVINDIVGEFAVGDAAYTGDKDPLNYGREKGKYDFGEEVGDKIESSLLSIGAGLMAFPRLLADTKTMIGESLGDIIPPGAQMLLNSPIMRATMPGLGIVQDFTQKHLVEAGEEAYNVFSKKSEQLNMTLADFGDAGMAEMLGDAFTGGDDGDYDLKKRIGSFVAGSTRITASALGSLPSVAQSMIPYVGIASIVAGEAARTNMESRQDGRPLDWARLGHAYTTGASEGLLELVTKKIGSGMFKGLRGGSKEAVEQTLRQYGTKVMKEFGQEGLSEVGTEIINQLADYAYKDEVDEWFPKFSELIDTFLVGGVMGGGMSAVGVGGQILNNSIARKNIKGSLQKTGFKSLDSLFDSINPLSEGGVSQEIASGMEDSNVKRERLEDTGRLKDTKRIKQVDKIKKKPSKTEIQETSEIARKDAMENAVIENRPNDIAQQNEAKTVTIKDGKPVSELTVNEKADAEHEILTNPSTEMFLNTELKRKVEAGLMTTTKADQIRANFKAKQGAANRMQGLGYTGEQRQKAINLLAEKENLQNKVKAANDSGLTKPEQDRINEINSELGSIPRSAEQQANIDAQVEQDVAFTEKFANIGTKDGEFKDAVGENKAVQAFETTQEFEQIAKDNGIDVSAEVDGFVLPNGQIFLNKQKMREAGAIGVGRHELLHKILKQQFSGPNGEKLKNDFLKILQETDPQGYALLMEKMELYSEQELKDAPDEYLANYASLLIEGSIPLETFETKPSLVKRLGDFFSNIFADAANENPTGPNVKASDIGFESGKDLYDFVRGYVKDSQQGVLSDRAQQLAEQGVGDTTSKRKDSRTKSAELDALTPNQRLALEGKGPLTMVKDASGNLVMDYGPIAETLDKRKSPYRNVKGRSGIPKFSKTKTQTPLEAINNLIPANIKTKEQFDMFMRDNKTALPIASALLPGGVINNYIRSRETSREQGDKMIDEMYERIFNFNPEATRADGTIVGPKGFGESIFANTRFAKMVANKALAEKGERQKQEKRIDGEQATQIADDTAPIIETKDTTLAKKPSETTGLDKQTEAEITKAVNNAFKGEDVKFSETRNIPQEVADIYANLFGINPETIVNKKRNFQKTDSQGLTKAKQFLLKNATNDFARLPRTKDDFGKGTFVPKNVRDALYTDGELTGTLKDYIDLIREKPVKPIYRDRVGQTIRGLLALHIRNRMIETAQPVQGKRIQSGVKFSKTKINSLLDTLNKSGINTVMKSLGEGYKTINKDNREAVQTEIENSIKESGMPFAMFNLLKMGNFGRKRVYGNSNKKYTTKPAAEKAGIKNPKTYFEKKDGTYVEKGKPGSNPKDSDQWIAAVGNPYYGDTDPAFIKASELAKNNDSKYPEDKLSNLKKAQRIKIPEGTRINKNKLLPNKRTVAAQEKINQDALMDFIDLLNKKKDGKLVIPLRVAGMFVAQSYQATTGLIKIAAPFVGVSERFIRAKKGKRAKSKESYIEEHSPPASVVGAAILWGLKNGGLGRIKQGIKDNFIQVQLSNNADLKLDLAKLDSNLPKGVSIFTPNAGIVRLAAAGINLNTITDLNTGKSLADKAGLPLPKELRSNPSAVNYQNRLLVDSSALQSDPKKEGKFLEKPEMTLRQAKSKLNNKGQQEIQKLKQKNVDKTVDNFGDQIFSKTKDAEQNKTVMVNSFETMVLAKKYSKTKKGISVFDFDDTLARTKERVIVNMADGTTKEISAAEFAKQAGKLTEQGAEFDFSNFENVAKGTKEGPLADLARKRQGKFGSGDIFVLTARPNSAGPAIQAFLKSIGINIPLQNITGLSDGTPQAKADWVLNKTAEGYNDFYFADDSKMNVAGVKAVLDAVDVKNKVQQAKFSKSKRLNNEFNQQLQEVTGKESFKKYSNARARLEGKKKDGGFFKRFLKQFTITPSAEDFLGLLYPFAGKGEQGNKHLKFLKDNLIDPYNKAEQELLSAQVTVANDFAALKKQFPSLRSRRGKNPLLENIGVGPFTKSQAIRVYLWNKQGMDIPGMSKRDIADLVKAVESDNELNIFADEVGLIQKGERYPAPGQNWLAGDIASDIMQGLKTELRVKLMTEFNENSDIIFSPENLNKIEALYGSKYREALEDSLRRMKAGTNRPVYTSGGSRIVNEMLDWLNSSVGAVMFLNMRSGILQLISNVNFINWGDNNMYAAAKAFASKDYFPTVLKLLNSDYLVNRRDGLKINVNEAELTDAGKKGGVKGMINYLLDKGFAITRIMDSVAIATGGATFFINRKKALLNRTNPETNNKYTEAEAEKKAFDDFYEIAEETQQSSNPSKISQQQASLAGRLILSFQNVTMQYNRKTKKSILDLYNRRRKPGMTQRESDLSNLSSAVYYMAVQNMIFHGLQQALFKLAFDDEEDEDEKIKVTDVVNGMSDSILFGLGFGGAIVSTVKNLIIKMSTEAEKKSPQYEDALWDIFNLSPVIDSKIRKLRTAAKTFQWNMKEIKNRGFSIDNPAYLAISQIISATTNVPIDRVLQKVNNIRQATEENTRMYERIALLLGWSGYIFDLPYWGRQSTVDREKAEEIKLKEKYKKEAKKLKANGYKRVPLTGPNSGKPKGELNVDYIEVERPSGEIEYWRNLNTQ